MMTNFFRVAAAVLMSFVFVSCAVSDTVPSATPVTEGDLDGLLFNSVGALAFDSVSGSSVPSEYAGDLVPTVSLKFSSDLVTADAGCNSFSASYEVDSGVLSVGEMMGTRMACSSELMELESWMVNFLSSSPFLVLKGDALSLSTSLYSLSMVAVDAPSDIESG